MAENTSHRQWRLFSHRHPVHGLRMSQVSPNVMLWAVPFEDWGMEVHVYGPTERFTVECDWFRLYAVDEAPGEDDASEA
jgi:hypothetical protein